MLWIARWNLEFMRGTMSGGLAGLERILETRSPSSVPICGVPAADMHDDGWTGGRGLCTTKTKRSQFHLFDSLLIPLLSCTTFEGQRHRDLTDRPFWMKILYRVHAPSGGERVP